MPETIIQTTLIISTNFGIPPFSKTQFAVETKLSDGMITSQFLILNNDNAIFRAAVPLLTAKHSSALTYFLNLFSNLATFPIPAPDAQNLLRNVSKTAFSSASSIYGSNRLIFLCFH